MNFPRLSQVKRHAAAIVGGWMLSLAFPNAGAAVFAWLVPGLWMLCARDLPVRQACVVGFLGGLAFHLTALSWLNNIPYPVMPTIGWLALGSYLSIYTGAWFGLCALRLGRHRGMPPQPWFRRAADLALLAAAWVALELAVSRLLTGFPWLMLAHSQFRMLPLIQVASFTGAMGVSFVVAWFSLALAETALSAWRTAGRPWMALADLTLPGLTMAMILAFGLGSLLKPVTARKEISFALIQPSIPQTVKWDADANKVAFEKVLTLSETALSLRPHVLAWPEAATPGYVRYDDALIESITGMARKHGVWIVFGGADAVAKAGDPSKADFFNSAFLVNPKGELAGKYDKQHLVIFGEYVPLSRWLPFLSLLTPAGEGYKPGPGPVLFRLEDHDLTIAPMICFEDVFGPLARGFAGPDTDLLLNLTNDGWFGEGAAQWQHAAMSVFRAVENRRALIRCTNNGLTCWIDPRGRMYDAGFGPGDDIYGAGFKIVKVPLPSADAKTAATFYNRHGDWFGWCCAAATLMCFLPATLGKRAGDRSAGGADSSASPKPGAR